MTLGETEVVPAAVAAADSKNAVDIGMNDSGHHSISATPDSQTAEDAAAANLPVESIFKFTINPSVGEPFDLQVNSAEMIQELHQVLLEREATCHRTCFTLQLNGVPLDNFTEIRNIPDLVDGSTLQVVDEPYTLRDARIHLRQVRELLRSPDVAEAAGGVDGSSLTYLPTINIQERKDKENKPFDGQPPESVVPGVKDRPLSQLLPTTPRGPAAVRDIAISSFNPVPGWRKLKGDILYITVDLVEKRRLHITCCTKGFFVNASSDHSFNPAPNSQHKTVYHSLVDLLNAASPAFKKAYALLLKRRGERALLERLPTPYPVYSWLAPGQDVSEDSLRAEESTQPHRVGFEEHLPGQIRDWNEELQTTHEMAQTELSDRIIRDRSVYKIHGDFIGAAIKGAQAVVEGNVMAINPADEPRTHMYIWNNIFYSLGFDVKDHYKELGGDAASFAATSADLQGVRAYAALENTKLCTLGMAVIDYKGYRVTAQSIIPGILDRDQEQSVIYGSIDFGKTVVSSEKYHELLESAAKTLKILPHEVVVGENGETAKLYTSFETKGIIGNDGRQYVLDLLRTMPPDVHFMENGPVSEKAKALGFPRKHPHKLAALRVELIDNFYETRCLQYIRVAAQHIRQNMAENKDKEAQSESEQEITRILVEVSEGRVPQTDNAETRVALRKAAEAVNSLNPDTFDVRFNPDCFSEAVKHAPTENIEKQKQLVVEAADFLLTSQLPDLVKACLDGTLNPIDGQCFTELMHARGINIRYLGEVAKKVVDTQSYMRPLVACELVARCLKHVLRPFIFPLPQDQIASAVSHLLRAVFGPASSDGTVSPVEKVNKKSSKKSKKVSSNGEWASVSTKSVWKAVCEEAAGYYGFELTVDCVDALCEQFGIQKVSLLRRICRALGIQLLNRDYQLDVSKGKAMFTEDDVQAIYPVVKHRDPGAADAKKCYQRGQQAMQMGNLKEAYEFVAESVNLMTSVYGAIHCELAQGLRFLARLSYILGEPGEALAHQHKATLMSERCNGLDSGHTIVEYINLAHFAFANLYISAALRLLYRARYLLLIAHGEKHPVMAQIDGNIGVILFAVQEFDSAIKFLQSAEAISNPGEPKRLKSAFTYHIMARAHASRGDFRAALSAEKETNAIYCNLFGAEHEKTKDSSEFLKVLTQQAVSFQKRIMEANKGSSIAQLMPQQIPQLSLSAIVEILNILNGIIIISMGGSNNQEVESLKEAVGQPAAIPVPVNKAIDMKEEELD